MTMPPQLRKVLLICTVCLLLAGCGGTTNETHTTIAKSPSPQPSVANSSTQVSPTPEPTATPTPSPPPGTNTSTLNNVQTLLNAHYDVLEEHDYVVTYRYQGPDDLREGNVEDATDVTRSGIIASNHTAKQQIIDKEKELPDGTVTNKTEYTEDTITYYRFGAVGPDGSPHDVYYTVTRWENTEFMDRHVTAIPLLTLTQYRLRAYDTFFKSDFTRTNVSTIRNHTYHTYRPVPDSETSGFVRIREDGFIKTIQLRTTIAGESVRLHRTFELGPNAVELPDWKQLAILADRQRSGSSGNADCDDFATQAGAQIYHESNGGDGLDGDGDGRACEHLP